MQKQIRTLAARPEVAALLTHWQQDSANVLNEALAIQGIAAPTFEEAARAAYVEGRFRSIGLADVSQDALGNVYARLPCSRRSARALLVSAHLDTVFPAGTDLTTRLTSEPAQVHGPGIGDNSIGLAAMLALAEALRLHSLNLPADIWWVATVGEEGLGDLRGMRAALDRLGGGIGLAIILEGIGLGRIYHAGLGVRRLKITVRGPGGHSWLHAGQPSAIHHLLKIGAALVEGVVPPRRPRSSTNIGLISGGTSINTLAPEASLSIDLRSVDSATLARLESEVAQTVARFADAPDLRVTTEVVGDRPSAALSPDHPLVRGVQHVLRFLNAGPGSREIGSTDANIPLARHIPSACIGITSGGGAHTADEFIATAPIGTGMGQLLLVSLLALQNLDVWCAWESGR